VADPFAPPSDNPRRRVPTAAKPAPAYEPEPAAWAEPRESREPRDPAHPGLFWVVAAIGVGLLCLGRLIAFFSYMGDLDGEDVAPAVFGVFGVIALAVGLALAAVMQRGLSTAVRAALILGAGFFAMSGDAFGLLASLSGSPCF
jgi:hypothetical protein